MFTPQEVSEKAFPKSSFGSGGYSMTAVDEFLDTLTEDYSTLYKENAALKTKLKVLAEKVEEYRATEDAMRSTLLTAQKMAAKLVQEAQTEKENLLGEAHRQHAQELERLSGEQRQAEEKLVMAQQSLAEFIRRSGEMCRQQADFLQTLPELQLVQEKAAPTEESVPAAAPEEDILQTISAMTGETEAAGELPASIPDAPADVSARSAIPSDFKLSLDELKFGRNYNAD